MKSLPRAPSRRHDETKTRAYLTKGFREAGYTVDAAEDAEEARFFLSGARFDLLGCDVMLPGEDGWSLVRSLRQGGLQIPVLFLTARTPRGADWGSPSSGRSRR